MPENKTQQVMKSSSTESHGRTSEATRKYRKAPGTRVGVMADWRAAGARVVGEKEHGKRLRDGR